MTSAQRARDEALDRIRSTRRWAIVGSGALTLGLAGLVSAVAPGRTLGAGSRAHADGSTTSSAATATSRRGQSSTARLVMPPAASPAQLGLQGPGSPPQAVPVPAPPSSAAPSGGGQSSPAPSSGAVSGGS